jgi:cyclohexanecarboxylate-CoA ligase
MIAPTQLPTQPYAELGIWSDRTLGSYLHDAAASSPDALALVDGTARLSYAELQQRVSAAAAGLAGVGVGAGDAVCVMLPNWWEAMVAMQSILSMGAVVNPVVPIYRDREVGFIVHECRPRVVIVPHRFRRFDYVEMMQRIVAESDEPMTVVVVRPEGPLPRGFLAWDGLMGSGVVAPTPVSPGDIALLLYTSGTTADPKGVLHSHQTLDYENRSIISLLDLKTADTVFMPSPITHITGFLYGVLLPAMTGAACVLLAEWDPVVAHRLIEDERCRFTLAATPFLAGLVEQYERSGTRSALRSFPCGGADVPPELIRRARDVLGADVVRVYGSSEFPTVSCGGPCDSERIATETDGRLIGPVDARVDEPVNGVGELLVRGPEMFLGYLATELNRAAFTPDGYFRTGDLASLDDDGAVTIRGRLKDIINRGGEKISAKEVEDLLFEHPSVREVAVVAMPDPKLVEKVCAFVVSEPGAKPVDLPEICAYLEARRIARQKLPERLVLVDALPKTASGKVQKFVLREQVR